MAHEAGGGGGVEGERVERRGWRIGVEVFGDASVGGGGAEKKSEKEQEGNHCGHGEAGRKVG